MTPDNQVISYKTSFMVVIAIAIACVFPRWPAIVENTLLLDDYLLGGPDRDIYLSQRLKGWSGLLWIEQYLGDLVLGDRFILSIWPKILAITFFTAFSYLAFRILEISKINLLISAGAIIVFALHPVVSEILLWNTAHAFSLSLCLVAAGYYCTFHPNQSVGVGVATLATFIGASGYQLYFSAFLIFMLVTHAATLLNEGSIDYRLFRKQVIVFVLSLAGRVLFIFVSVRYFDLYQERAIIEYSTLDAYLDSKVHGIVNIIVNTVMPIIAWHGSLGVAYRTWEWVIMFAMALGAAGGFVTGMPLRRVAVAVLLLPALLLLPTLVILLIGQSPESWRISVPSWLGFCLYLALVLSVFSNKWPAKRVDRVILCGMLVVALAILYPVTRGEARLRVDAQRWDREVLERITGFWSSQGESQYHVVSTVHETRDRSTDSDSITDRLTVAYSPYMAHSNLDFDWSWKDFLLVSGFRVRTDLASDAGLATRCRNNPDHVQPQSGIKLLHLQGDRTTLVCY